MDFFSAMDISASGLSAQRTRMNVISDNLANANTTRTNDGQPYRRKHVLFAASTKRLTFENVLRSVYGAPTYSNQGVRVTRIVQDQTPFPRVYDPGHPDADASGYVTMPNVNVVSEMVNMLSAARSYESNITALMAAKEMAKKSLEIGS